MTALETAPPAEPGGKTGPGDGSGSARFPNGAFRALWAATGVSQAGSAVSNVAIPLCAAVTLGASAPQMTGLAMIELVPSLLIRMPAAAWSDRLRRPRVPLMSACNLAQAVTMGAVPVLWWTGALTMLMLFALATVASLALGVYSALSNPVLNSIVPKQHLVDATGKLSATRSAADISGPTLGGMLLAVLAAPAVVLVDAVSFLASAVLLIRVHPAEAGARTADRAETAAPVSKQQPDTAGAEPVSTAGSWRFAVSLLRRSQVRAVMAVAFIQGLTQPVLVLFLVRGLDMRSSAIGLLLALGAVGGVGGGWQVGGIQRRLGAVRTVALGAAANVAALALLPFAAAGLTGMAGLVLLELGGSFGGTLLIASVFGGLQTAAPRERVARVMAAAMMLLQAAGLAGVPLGGALATLFGLRTTMVAAFGLTVCILGPQLIRWAATGWAPDRGIGS
jgi:predicted MFS family arabinose efflux permease